VRQVSELNAVRAGLLPAAGDPDVDRLIDATRRVQALVDRGLDEDPLAFFAAAEAAREQLGAEQLAASLFQAYADSDPETPWVGKALLAAHAASADPVQRAALARRIAGLVGNPYVRYARGDDVGNALAPLERVLDERLGVLQAQVRADLAARRQLLVPDTTGG
ncbi:MAG: hypothetical protein D6701_13530, partial [Gemmatimonadetes bacterium]